MCSFSMSMKNHSRGVWGGFGKRPHFSGFFLQPSLIKLYPTSEAHISLWRSLPQNSYSKKKLYNVYSWIEFKHHHDWILHSAHVKTELRVFGLNVQVPGLKLPPRIWNKRCLVKNYLNETGHFHKYSPNYRSAYVTLQNFTPGLQKNYTDISAISVTFRNSGGMVPNWRFCS